MRREWSYHRLEVSIESKRGMMCVCARAIDKECHRICVCPRQRYRVAGLLERERGQVQFVSVAWIPTYNVRLSVCVWGGVETGRLVYVWGRRET